MVGSFREAARGPNSTGFDAASEKLRVCPAVTGTRDALVITGELGVVLVPEGFAADKGVSVSSMLRTLGGGGEVVSSILRTGAWRGELGAG
jgi:hypothetical protein